MGAHKTENQQLRLEHLIEVRIAMTKSSLERKMKKMKRSLEHEMIFDEMKRIFDVE
jgi:hypothetical protein